MNFQLLGVDNLEEIVNKMEWEKLHGTVTDLNGLKKKSEKRKNEVLLSEHYCFK